MKPSYIHPSNSAGFADKRKLEGDPAEATAFVKTLTKKMAESKGLVKEFERVSQEDPSVDPEQTAQRKREMVKQLNDYVQRKKAAQADIAARQEQLEAMAGASPAPGAKKGDPKPDPFAAARDAAEREKTNPFSSSGATGASTSSTEPPAGADDAGAPGGGSKFSKFSKSSNAAAAAQSEIVAPGEIELQGMQTEELLVYGRDKIKDTDAIIDRSKETVARTIQLGTQTAEQLRNQTEQMEKVVDDLDEIHFSLKKSMKVIKDLTRGLATDKCILTLLFVVVMGVVAIIAVKMAGLDEDDEVASVRRRLLYSRRLLRMEPGDPFEPAHVPWRGTSHH